MRLVTSYALNTPKIEPIKIAFPSFEVSSEVGIDTNFLQASCFPVVASQIAKVSS